MAATALLLVTMIGASAVSSESVRWFPGDYYDARVREPFRAEVMEGWPGPNQLARLWDNDRLDEADRVSLLLGGAAFHDPVLLPAYREAVTSSSRRVRQAAVYGYRDLLGDSLPDVSGGISDRDAALFVEEIDLMAQTLAQRSLVELWLQALLANESYGLPGWRGLTLRRPSPICFHALEQLVEVGDLGPLLEAYDTTDDFGTRVNLLKFVESITLSRFIVKPTGAKAGWGRHVFTTAFDAMRGARRRWSGGGCTVDGETVLVGNLESLGVTGVDPLGADGCGVWVGVLDQGYPPWWRLAARRLYACGGPWVEISALFPEGEPNPALRNRLLDWYRPLIRTTDGSAHR